MAKGDSPTEFNLAGESLESLIAQDDLEPLRFALGSLTDDTPASDAQLRAFACLAIRSWVDLVLGRKRYRSLTEQYIVWLEQLYSEVFSDEEPGDPRIRGRLSFPDGQATYLSRMLRDRQQLSWRRRALQELYTRLHNDLANPKVQEALRKSAETTERNIQLTKGQLVELKEIVNLLARSSTPLRRIKIEPTLGDVVYITMYVQDLKLIVDALERRIRKENPLASANK